MIQIAIVDDNQYYIDEVKRMLLSANLSVDYEVYEYTTCIKFREALENINFDIIFLDIVLDNEDGIALGTYINERNSTANIIFISSEEDYFKDVYKVKHSYFLTKEFEKTRFDDAVKKAISSIQRENLLIHDKNKYCRIELNRVMYFENALKHTLVHMCDGTVDEYNVSLNEIEAKLRHRHFIRVHKSFIINMMHIKKYGRQFICFDDECQVPISRTYLNATREKINLYLGDII